MFINNLIKKILFKYGYSIVSEYDKKNNKGFDKLKKNSKTLSSIKLHFGCGGRILKGWVNIDIIYNPNKDYSKQYGIKYYPKKIRGTKSDLYIFDITAVGLPLPNNSVDLIFHEDFIEHLDQKQQIIFLAETFRVMKKNAIQRINTPNLLASMNKWSQFNRGKDGVYAEEWYIHGHKNILTSLSLFEVAKMIGYTRIEINKRDESKAKKNLPLEYRPDPIRDKIPNGNIFVDLIK